LRKKGGLEEADILEQLLALASKPRCPGARECVGRPQQQRESPERRDGEPDRKGDDPDDVADRLGQGGAAVGLRRARP